MASVEEAREILEALGMPPAQRNRMSAMTLLALCGLGPDSSWSEATREPRTVTKGIMDHLRKHFGTGYAANTRETFRRQVLHQFVQGGVAGYNPFDPGLPTNSPHAHYAVTESALEIVRLYGTKRWESAVEEFRQKHGTLKELYGSARDMEKVPVRIFDGTEFRLSPGKHNELQKAVVEEFAPRFAPGALLLYMGDTSKKDLFLDKDGLARLNISVPARGKLPDIILHDEARDWIFLVEAVTSHGPMTPKRVVELEKILEKSRSPSIHVSAFADFAELGKHIKNIAWETEVWVADSPDHMIHYDGDRFLGPNK